MLASVQIFVPAYLSVILALSQSVGLSPCLSICLPVRLLACLFTKQPVRSLLVLQSASSSKDRRSRQELSGANPDCETQRPQGTREAGRLRLGRRCDRIDRCVFVQMFAGNGVGVCLLREAQA